MTDEIAAAFDGIDPADVPESVDRAALERMRTVAMVLDESIELPIVQYRIGLDPLLSVIPGVGDAVSAGISLYIVIESARLGVSFTTLVGMLARIGVDYAGGSIPIVGPPSTRCSRRTRGTWRRRWRTCSRSTGTATRATTKR